MRGLLITLVVLVLLGSKPEIDAAEDRDWFSSREVLELQLEAPFAELLASGRSNPEFTVTGRLSYFAPGSEGRVEISGVRISTRGHTSRQPDECEFPKLKLQFTDADPTASLFARTAAVKLGTHCADRPDQPLTPKFGRLANEKAPFREALAYALLDAVQVPTLRTRPARITYVFTDATGRQRAPLVRNALLIEDDDQAMKRLQAASRLTEDRFDTARSAFDEADTTRLAFAQAMIGNFDWCLRFFDGDQYRCDDVHPLWNILGIARADGSTLPVIYDFDLSAVVVGRHNWFDEVFSESFAPSTARAGIEVLAQLQRTRSLFSRDRLDNTRREFLAHRGAAYRAIADSAADRDGQRLATNYLDRFFTMIESDEQFYRPVIMDEGVEAYLDSRRQRPACGGSSVIPIGTPVSAPLAVEGNMVQVRLLDAMWHWVPPRRCDRIHRQPVWVPQSAVGVHHPR